MTATLVLKDEVILTIKKEFEGEERAFKVRKVPSYNLLRIMDLSKKISTENMQSTLEEMHRLIFRHQADETFKTIDFDELMQVINKVAEAQTAPLAKSSGKTRTVKKSRGRKRK